MSDTHDLTPWEEINPMTVSARQQGPQSPSLADERAVFRNELTACLSLVVPVGMSEEARRDWLAVAWQTLKDIPPDILKVGAHAARGKCDHPSKIVPTILAECKDMLQWRRGSTSGYGLALPPPTKRHVMDRRGEPMTEEDTARLNEILENLGATARYRSDGSRYTVAGIDG